MRTSNNHLATAAILALAQFAFPSAASASEYLRCDSGAIANVHANPIQLRTTPDQFPPGDPLSDALNEVFDGWNATASQKKYERIFIAEAEEGRNAYPNKTNEIYFTEDGQDNEDTDDWAGVCLVYMEGSECDVVEIDVVFNDILVNFTTSTDVADMPTHHGGWNSTFSLQTIGFHEFGHAQGLDHEGDVYNIMGHVPHHHTNGTLALAYPGEDAITGSIGLYGATPGGLNDLALAPFHRSGVDFDGYSEHSKNRVLHVANGPGSATPGGGKVVVSGEDVTMEVTVENMGTSWHPTTINYYLSSDANITTGDVFLGQHGLNVFPDHPTTINSPVLTLPNLTDGQDYWIGGVIDPANSISESNEWNNRTGIQVRAERWKPDYEAVFVTGPATAQTGDGGNLIASEFVNIGGPALALATYEIQLVQELDIPQPAYVSAITVLTVEGSDVGHHLDGVTIPGDVEPGEYNWAMVVSMAAGGEGDELNDAPNFVLGNAVTIEAGLTELVAAAVSGPAYGGDAFGIEAGDPVEVSVSIENLGEAPTLSYVYHVVLSLNDDIAVSDWIVASGETTSTGDFDVIGTFPDLTNGGTYKWGLIITNTQFGDDPSNNTMLGGEIVVSMDSEIGDDPGATDEFVTGPGMVVQNSTAPVSFQIPFVLSGAYDYRVVLMTPEQAAGTSKTAPIALSRTLPYAGGIIEVDVSVKTKSVPTGNYYWGVILPDPSPWAKDPFKVVVGNPVKVLSGQLGK